MLGTGGIRVVIADKEPERSKLIADLAATHLATIQIRECANLDHCIQVISDNLPELVISSFRLPHLHLDPRPLLIWISSKEQSDSPMQTYGGAVNREEMNTATFAGVISGPDDEALPSVSEAALTRQLAMYGSKKMKARQILQPTRKFR